MLIVIKEVFVTDVDKMTRAREAPLYLRLLLEWHCRSQRQRYTMPSDAEFVVGRGVFS